MFGVPDGYVRIIALPDQEPVEFPAEKCVRANWITDEMVEELTD